MTDKGSNSNEGLTDESPDSQADPRSPQTDPVDAATSHDPSAMDMPEMADPSDSVSADGQSLEMLGDVELDVKIELGRCQMLVGDVLRLAPGHVVELDKLAGDPVDVYVNDRLVARGEVLVVNDSFCVRVNQILSANE